MTSYQIETRGTNGQWTANVGDQNRFASEAEAEQAIESLRGLGDEWAAAEYRVAELQRCQGARLNDEACDSEPGEATNRVRYRGPTGTRDLLLCDGCYETWADDERIELLDERA